MPKVPERNLPIGVGGVAAEMGVSNPRRARPEVVRGQAARTPPPEEEITDNGWSKMLEPRPLPGRRGTKTGRVRWCHRVIVEGEVAICHAFTVSKETHDAVKAGEPLRAKDTIRPDGLPVVPKGVDPSTVAVRCASCGAEQVSTREMVFFQE
jgi:hypothetical protein